MHRGLEGYELNTSIVWGIYCGYLSLSSIDSQMYLEETISVRCRVTSSADEGYEGAQYMWQTATAFVLVRLLASYRVYMHTSLHGSVDHQVA